MPAGETVLDSQFQPLKQRICLVCGLRKGGRLRFCQNCQIMRLISEIQVKVRKLENQENVKQTPS